MGCGTSVQGDVEQRDRENSEHTKASAQAVGPQQKYAATGRSSASNRAEADANHAKNANGNGAHQPPQSANPSSTTTSNTANSASSKPVNIVPAASSAPVSAAAPTSSDSSASSAGSFLNSHNIQPNAAIGLLLKKVPLLSKLTDSERARLGGCLTEQIYSSGQYILREGEDGAGFYIIESGEVFVRKIQKDLTRTSADNGTQINEDGFRETELARLREGDFFGETALLNNVKRQASVRAGGNVKVFYLDRMLFYGLFSKDRLNVQFAKRQAVSAEQQSQQQPPKMNLTVADQTATLTPVGALSAAKRFGYVTKHSAHTIKSDPSVTLIKAAIQDNVLFMNLTAEQTNAVIHDMYRELVPAGSSPVKQGEIGDAFYVVDSGSFDVLIDGTRVATRGPASAFGELALMYNAPRAATVTATEDSAVWVVDRFTFRRILSEMNEKKFSLYVQFLKKVELLSPLAEYERKKIAEALEEQSRRRNEEIFLQGHEGDAMFIVFKGEVAITKREQYGAVEEKEVMRCKEGDYFGERALLTNEARAASATCVTDCVLLKLDRSAFALLLGPLEDIMKSRMKSYEEREKREKEALTPSHAAKPGGSGLAGVSALSLQMLASRPAWEDLKPLGTLGKGSFGFVRLMYEEKSKKTYALKGVSKAQIVQTGQQGHVMSEKRAMLLLDHPFCIKLYGTYKDRDRLYFLLEPALGGELFTVLRERTLFDEETARFYAASVLLAFEYMHDVHNIVYRDLKPENLLLDNDGYLKVTDFGFAKDISSGRTWTLCGTPDYLAPEIVAGKGHGKGVDWWTFGVFIYEMLASYPPFYDEDPMKTYQKIMAGVIDYPSHFSRDAVSLISKLLQAKPTKRLGVVKDGAKAIKQHQWFKNFDWDGLLARKLRPPIIPKVKNNMDLSNFDDHKLEPAKLEPYKDDGTNWDADF